MCGGKTTVSNAAAAAAPAQAQMGLETTKSGMGNLFTYGVPDMYTPDIQGIETQLGQQTELADLVNKEYERRTNPELYALRESIMSRASDVFNPDTAVTNELLKRGLISATNNLGPAAKFGPGTAANMAVQKIYGPAYQDYQTQLLNNLNSFLGQNPRKAVKLDPETAVSLTEGAKAGRVDLSNMRKNQLLTGTSGASGGLQNYYSGIMSGVVNEAGNAANAKTAASQQQTQNMMNLLTLPLKAAQTASMF